MKRWIKILIGIIATPVLLFIILLTVYILVNRQGVIEPYQVGNPNAEVKVLIASQGSEFKNNLVEQIINKFNDQNTYFSVVDCTSLEDKNEKEWNAVIIIHTMQIHEMPKEAKMFLSEVDDLSRIMLVSTSGGGDDMVQDFNVDAISAPSRPGKIPGILEWINNKMENKINPKSLMSSF